ncbi:aminotransferase class V-fold PLP-dependent enzyme [Pararhodobacter zhoushanensis]|uniref:Aminotransferase class V-fold PLP-dependent enzyme n=1 Tax=Pararhodobacter zhoushanensis TaxID=2479545 RepID=A0ABT3GYS9_9RHOB|nr:aminotransferase class V-fold PLP-dependent enzyme [Pararhodobacter zhoushanensis]MCW1932687.1 aminotransferase class V-fold PLP-dependent enzyme [Pararhodobacter zhoushanensis]
MPALHDAIDQGGLEEFSVVFTDRSLNHMSQRFQGVMRDISGMLKEVYNGSAVALVPGGGTFAMESVARQFARGKCLVVRNGLFSFRWSAIFDAGDLNDGTEVMMARPGGNGPQAAYAPAPIAEVTAKIRAEAPQAVFAPHVETSAGMILPDDYIKALADAAHEVGALMVLDCIASGAAWVDMKALGVDVLVSAPQKGWSASPSAGIVVMGPRAEARLAETTSDSFALDLKKWRAIMKAYEDGGHAYHATLPTDALAGLRDAMLETKAMGFEAAKKAQCALGKGARALLAAYGHPPLAAEGFGAPGVVVCFTERPELQNGSAFAAAGYQIAAGVPLMVGEGDGFRTFRIGLFGLDKLKDVPGTLSRLDAALKAVELDG